jgi:hypothetical protein
MLKMAASRKSGIWEEATRVNSANLSALLGAENVL